MTYLALFLGLASASPTELALEKAQAALDGERADIARDVLLAELNNGPDTDYRVVDLFMNSLTELGLNLTMRALAAQMEGEARTTAAWWQLVHLDIDRSTFLSLTDQDTQAGRFMRAREAVFVGDMERAVEMLDAQPNPYAVDLRAELPDGRKALKQWWKTMPDRPDAFARVAFGTDAVLPMLQKQLIREARQMALSDDETDVWRAREVYVAAGLREEARALDATLGDSTRLPDGPRRSVAALTGMADSLLDGRRTDLSRMRASEVLTVGMYAADTCRVEGEPERAMEVWDVVLRTSPSRGGWLGYSEAAVASNRPDDAIGAAEEALVLSAAPARGDWGRHRWGERIADLAAAYYQYTIALLSADRVESARWALAVGMYLYPRPEYAEYLAGDRPLPNIDPDAASPSDTRVWAEAHANGALNRGRDSIALALDYEAASYLAEGDAGKANVVATAATMVAPTPGRLIVLAQTQEALGYIDAAVGSLTLAREIAVNPTALDAHFASVDAQRNEVFGVKEPTEPAPMPSWAGGGTNSAELEGRRHVVVVWATWCGPCHDLLPELDALYARQGGEYPIVALSIDEEEESLRSDPLVKQLTGVQVVHSPQIVGDFGLKSVPVIYVVDEQGGITYMGTGYGPQVVQQVEEALSGS